GDGDEDLKSVAQSHACHGIPRAGNDMPCNEDRTDQFLVQIRKRARTVMDTRTAIACAHGGKLASTRPLTLSARLVADSSRRSSGGSKRLGQFRTTRTHGGKTRG